jgi:hypothetical protein
MRDTTIYGKLDDDELRDELVEVCAALVSAYNELGPLQADKSRTFIEFYARSPGNSVAAKEREADYHTLEINNDIQICELRIEALQIKRQLLEMLLYA